MCNDKSNWTRKKSSLVSFRMQTLSFGITRNGWSNWNNTKRNIWNRFPSKSLSIWIIYLRIYSYLIEIGNPNDLDSKLKSKCMTNDKYNKKMCKNIFTCSLIDLNSCLVQPLQRIRLTIASNSTWNDHWRQTNCSYYPSRCPQSLDIRMDCSRF